MHSDRTVLTMAACLVLGMVHTFTSVRNLMRETDRIHGIIRRVEPVDVFSCNVLLHYTWDSMVYEDRVYMNPCIPQESINRNARIPLCLSRYLPDIVRVCSSHQPSHTWDLLCAALGIALVSMSAVYLGIFYRNQRPRPNATPVRPPHEKGK